MGHTKQRTGDQKSGNGAKLLLSFLLNQTTK
ncbi:Uncharacterised protein [Vibrio cholerae]|nr:Uncharacterised protein [Vibrio cholerae]CRZ67714.1 Uncharacterised protein [Vibrio cholerae]CSB38406.1 Uncharacterised protein [Vibrio cholerae]CSB57742.1 Uncharacterised protein [Vibrio cholerae]CSB67476.1 Uncharacterised protein [Vibrio cholerae]